MKKYSLSFLLISMFLGLQAQSYIPRNIGITAGVGANLHAYLGVSELLLYLPLVYNTMADIAISETFSLGVGGSYTEFKEKGYYSTTRFQRLNVGIRSSFLIKYFSSEKFHLYLGSRVGHGFWRVTNSATPGPIKDYFNTSPVTFQAYLGMNAFINRKMAINFEFGFPGPYFFQMGMYVKTK